MLYSRDYDKAKEVIDDLTELINHYEGVIPANAPPSTFAAIQDWLIANLEGFKGEKNDVKQSLSFDPENTLSATFTTTSSNAKEDELEFYTFISHIFLKNSLFLVDIPLFMWYCSVFYVICEFSCFCTF